MNAEDLILAQNLKTERNTIPVNITAAVDAGRIDPNEFIDEGMKDYEETLKSDVTQGKEKYDLARKEEKKAILRLKRRDQLKNGTIKPTKDQDKGPLYNLSSLHKYFIRW